MASFYPLPVVVDFTHKEKKGSPISQEELQQVAASFTQQICRLSEVLARARDPESLRTGILRVLRAQRSARRRGLYTAPEFLHSKEARAFESRIRQRMKDGGIQRGNLQTPWGTMFLNIRISVIENDSFRIIDIRKGSAIVSVEMTYPVAIAVGGLVMFLSKRFLAVTKDLTGFAKELVELKLLCNTANTDGAKKREELLAIQLDNDARIQALREKELDITLKEMEVKAKLLETCEFEREEDGLNFIKETAITQTSHGWTLSSISAHSLESRTKTRKPKKTKQRDC